LAILLVQSGAVVTCEQLRKQLWPADTFVDFDHSIDAAMPRLREVLSDEAENPRFIETLSRRGYRFIAPVNRSVDGMPTAWTGHKVPRPIFYKLVLLVVCSGSLAGAAWLYFSRLESKLPPSRVVPVTSLPGRAEDAALPPYGNEVAFRRLSNLPDVSGIYIEQIGSEYLLQLPKSSRDFSPVCSQRAECVSMPLDRAVRATRLENGHS